MAEYEYNEEVYQFQQLAHKRLLSSTHDLALNSAHGVAFHRGLGTPIYPTSSSPFQKYISERSLTDYAKSAYAKSNIAVVANGAEHGEFAKWVGEFFKDTFTGSALQGTPSKYHGGEERIAHGNGNTLVLAFPGSSSFTSGSSYKPEIPVLAALLGGESAIKWSPGFSLLSKASSEYQHAHVSTTNAAYSDAGLFYVTIDGNAQHVAKAAKNVVDTLKKVAAGDVSSEDVKKAIAAAKFTALELGQSTDAGIEATGNGLISNGKPFQIEEAAKTLDKVTEAQVKSVCTPRSLIQRIFLTNFCIIGGQNPA